MSWSDGYLTPIAGGSWTGFGYSMRVRDGQQFEPSTEELHQFPDTWEPTGPPSVVACRVDQPERRTIKLVFNTPVVYAGGEITTPTHTVTGVRVAGHIVYISLLTPITEPTTDDPTFYPESVTVGPEQFYCFVTPNPSYPDGRAWYAGNTTTITRRYEYTLLTDANYPPWAAGLFWFNSASPPPISTDPANDVDVSATLEVPDHEAEPGNIRWYLHNPTPDELGADQEFDAELVVGPTRISPIPAVVASSTVQPILGYGAGVVVSFDADKVTVTANDTREVAEGGGSETFVGTVLGGNAQLRSPGVTGPSIYAYPLPMTEDGTAVLVPEIAYIDDWSYYLLPSDYAFGDPLPTLPPGLCYVRLERPSRFKQYSWSAAFKTQTKTKSAGVPLFSVAECDYAEDPNTVRLVFDRDVTSTGSGSIMLDGVLIDPSVSFDGNVCTLLLDAPLLFYTPQTLTISASFFSSTDPEPLMVAAISTTITIKAPAFSVVIAYNRHSYQTLYPGDLVMLVDRKTSITDDNDVTQEIPDIVGQVATLRSPHSHAYSRFDYGGSVAGAAQLGG